MKRLLLLLCLFFVAIIKAGAFDGNRAFVFVYGEGNDHYGYFIQMHGKDWGEFDWKGNRKKQTYTCISEHGDDVLLKDNVRKLFVRLTRNQCYLGKSQNDVNDKIYNGEWRIHFTGMSVAEFKKKTSTYFVYEKYGIQFIIARPKGSQSGEHWYAFDFSNWIELKQFMVQYQCRDYVIIQPLHSDEAFKITKDKIYRQPKLYNSNFTEWASGTWSNGQDYDVPEALKNEVRDSMYRILELRSFSYENIKAKGLDTLKLKLMATDIAKYYLHEIKKDQLRYLDSSAITLSVYDNKKHEASVVYQNDLYNVPMTAAEYTSLEKNSPDGIFDTRDYFYNGRKFKLFSFSMTDPVTHKTFKYLGKSKAMVNSILPLELNSFSIKMPSE